MGPKRHNNFLPTLVSDFWGEDVVPSIWGESEWSLTPAVNVLENDNGFKIEIAAPGIDKNDFKVHVEKNLLEISAEKENKQEVKEGKYLRKEFNYTRFKRTFSLPGYVDADKIKATQKNGVLIVDIPKKDESKEHPKKQISIE